MRSPAHCTSCCAFVGADAYIGPTIALLVTLRRGDPCGRPREGQSPAPTHRKIHFRRGRRPRRPAPNFCRTRQGTRALPYKALRYRGRADRVVRPYKEFRRGRCLHRPALPHPCKTPCHCEPVTDLLLWQSVPRPRKYFSLHAKKGPRHPAEPLFKPIQFIRNPHCPPCAGAAPHPGCCSLP